MRTYRTAEKGFTMIELLMVIVVLALIMSLAIGAAIRSVNAGRELRADSMRDALEVALVAYLSAEGAWPCSLPPDPPDPDNPSFIYSTFKSVSKNQEVFEKVISKGGYLDTSAFMTVVGGTEIGERSVQGGTRLSLRDALERSEGHLPIGYVNPKKRDEFIAYKITFNLMTDSVLVER